MKRTSFTMPPVIKRNGETSAAPDPARVQQFIEGGDQNSVTAAESKSAVVTPDVTARVPDVSPPWQDQDDKVRRPTFNIRLTNLEKACLEHINSKTPYSQHSFILSVLRPAIAAKMKELTGQKIESLLRSE